VICTAKGIPDIGQGGGGNKQHKQVSDLAANIGKTANIIKKSQCRRIAIRTKAAIDTTRLSI
jgi:hypothetical protein